MATSYYPVPNSMYWHETLLDELLDALNARPAAALLVAPRVRLYVGARTPDVLDDDPASFTEPGFTGYAAATPTFVGPVTLTDDGKGVQCTVSFLATAVTDPAETITGFYVTNDVAGSPTRVYAEGNFTSPPVIAEDGDIITMTLVLPIRALGER